MKLFNIIVSLFFLFSCNRKENSDIIPANSSDTIATEKDRVENRDLNTQVNDTIQMLTADKQGMYSAFGIIDSVSSGVYVKFTNDDTGILTAAITPVNGNGNIRFNQILFPDKTSDGPFGKDLEMELSQTGEHTLIIGHSLMADNPYSGKFKVELQVAAE